MPEVALYNMTGEQAGTVALSEELFSAPPNEAVLHQVVVAQQANLRQGTAATKTRSEVRGGGKKPWRQKGTGRARHGSRRAPDFKGGGIVHGPKPRSYQQKVNRQVRREALRSALVSRLQASELYVLDELRTEEPQTRVVAGLLSALSLEQQRVLVVTTGMDAPTALSVRNLATTQTLLAGQLSALDVLKCEALILTKEAVSAVEGRLS